MVGRHNYLLQIQNLSWMSTLLRISNGKNHSIMPSCRHHALFVFMHIYLLNDISEKKQKQQTVLALKEASRRWLNFGQLIKQIQQILNKLFSHQILRTIWKAGSTITGRQNERMQEAHSQRAAWQEVTTNTCTVLFLFSSTKKKTHPLNLKNKTPNNHRISLSYLHHYPCIWRVENYRLQKLDPDLADHTLLKVALVLHSLHFH